MRVLSRNGREWTDRAPLILEAMLALPVTSATIDGEGVVVDERGVTDFERLRAGLAGRGGSDAFAVIVRALFGRYVSDRKIDAIQRELTRAGLFARERPSALRGRATDLAVAH